MIAPTNCNPDCNCAQRMVRCQRAEFDDFQSAIKSPHPPCGTPDQNGWSCCGCDPCKRKAPPMVIPASLAAPTVPIAGAKNEPDLIDELFALEKEFPVTTGIAPNLTFDDVERISESADNYDRIAAAIESDVEWFVDDSIDDADIAKGLRLAAKALRSGVQP